jgi:hypothetical protein
MDDMIGGRDEHHRIGGKPPDVQGGETDARSSIPSDGLVDDVFAGDLGELFHDRRPLQAVGHDKRPLGRDDRREPPDGGLKH